MITEFVSEASRIKLMGLCRTRWVSRCDEQEVFAQFYPGGVKVLDTTAQVQIWTDWIWGIGWWYELAKKHEFFKYLTYLNKTYSCYLVYISERPIYCFFMNWPPLNKTTSDQINVILLSGWLSWASRFNAIGYESVPSNIFPVTALSRFCHAESTVHIHSGPPYQAPIARSHFATQQIKLPFSSGEVILV